MTKKQFWKEWQKLPREERQALHAKLLEDVPHSYIRDWCIMDATAFKTRTQMAAVILHMPSGMWAGFRLSYAPLVELVLTHPDPEADGQLYGIVAELYGDEAPDQQAIAFSA